MFGYLQFVYFTNRSVDDFEDNIKPDFVCFDAQKCPSLLSNTVHIEIIDGLTCFHISNLTNEDKIRSFNHVNSIFWFIHRQCLTTGNEMSCENPSYFHCNVSLKCISYYRVGDGVDDCYHGEDESFPSCQLNDPNRFKCDSDRNKCLARVAIGNGHPTCLKNDGESMMSIFGLTEQVPFQAICNSYFENFVSIENEDETDETNCEWWPCDHTL
jgi:hypothetical protein